MRTIRTILTFVAAILIGSCNSFPEASFSFSVMVESINEGEALPVVVAITHGPIDDYTIVSSVDQFDSQTGETKETEYALMSNGKPVSGTKVNFRDLSRQEFYIDGLAAGTYIITIELSKGGISFKKSAVAVVLGDDEGGGGVDPPEDDKRLEDFTISDLYLIDGVLPMDAGQEKRFRLIWTPPDVQAPVFLSESSNGDVVTTSVVDGFLVLRAVAAGEATVLVRECGGLEKFFNVLVKAQDIAIDSFDIVGLTLEDGMLRMKDDDLVEYPLSWIPGNATMTDFVVTSSDPGVASGDVVNGKLRLVANYPGDARLTVAADGGPSKSFNVRVTKDVLVTIYWNELSATETQIKTKTFPCYLVFSSDSNKAFPEPITWSLTMKGVVNISGQDTQSVTSKEDVKFYGNKAASYDVCTNVLIPCYSIYRTSSFTLSLTLSLQRNDSLNPTYWKVSYKEDFLTQDARIMQYITSIQQ